MFSEVHVKCPVILICPSGDALHAWHPERSTWKLTVDSLINPYYCFVGHHGPVHQINSDQGTNFVGGKNELHRPSLTTSKYDMRFYKETATGWITK